MLEKVCDYLRYDILQNILGRDGFPCVMAVYSRGHREERTVIEFNKPFP
jgi:hypothetical protein